MNNELFDPIENPMPSPVDANRSMISAVKQSKSKGVSPTAYRQGLAAVRRTVSARHNQTYPAR